MTAPSRRTERHAAPQGARRLLLAWLVGVAVFLMHASASPAGCPGGTHDAPDLSGQMPMAAAIAPPTPAAPATAAAVMDSPLSILLPAADGGGEVCVSRAASAWLAGLLRLLPLVVAGAATWAIGAHQPQPRPGHRWRAPPLADSLLTRTCVIRT